MRKLFKKIDSYLDKKIAEKISKCEVKHEITFVDHEPIMNEGIASLIKTYYEQVQEIREWKIIVQQQISNLEEAKMRTAAGSFDIITREAIEALKEKYNIEV